MPRLSFLLTLSTAADFPEALVLIIERQQAIAGIVALAALGTGDEATDVHSRSVVIVGNGKAGATAARNDKHAKVFLVFRIVLGRGPLHKCQCLCGDGASARPKRVQL